ncbi:MAG: glycosyl hydrolase family 17 protein [Planctomycetota bacterium]
MDIRTLELDVDGQWFGRGVSYGAYREGQAPHGQLPTREQLTEDLEIVAKHWNAIRMYGAREVSENVLQIIHEKKLPIRVMLGAWIARETPSDALPAADAAAVKAANVAETSELIRLANAYPDEVMAVSVGNETQVFWSAHKTEMDVLIGYLRAVRGATSVPVTTADDFKFWNTPESQRVANEVDFIVTHLHAMWLGQSTSTALPWTKENYAAVRQQHPSKLVVIGEAGWATQVHTAGEQAELIKGKAGEEEQASYYRQFTEWAQAEKIPTFYFEAFDEPWKGGPHPNEVEKHWGVFFVDRSPKAAMQ